MFWRTFQWGFIVVAVLVLKTYSLAATPVQWASDDQQEQKQDSSSGGLEITDFG